MDFWRAPAYTAFFEYLDASGGFYYEVSFFLPIGVRQPFTLDSAGEMRLYTALLYLYLLARTKYISSRI